MNAELHAFAETLFSDIRAAREQISADLCEDVWTLNMEDTAARVEVLKSLAEATAAVSKVAAA